MIRDRRSITRRALFRVGNWSIDWITRLLTFIGVLGIALWISTLCFGTSVILFATGSMSPAIPAGSAVLSVETPAGLLAPGQVVTVPQGRGELPVSHRIVEVRDVAGQPTARELTLKGDANVAVDEQTHIVTSAPRVVFVVPGAAYALQFLSDPRMMIAIGIILVGLMVRAFGADRIRRAIGIDSSRPTEPHHAQEPPEEADGIR